MSIAVKKDPALWQRARRDAIAKMGGVFSARAMQLATKLYKARGGRYEGPRRNNSLVRWTKEDWGYAGAQGQSRYLPRAVRSRLTPSEKARTNRAKRSAQGQWSRQPADVAAKASRIRRSLWARKKATPKRKPRSKKASPRASLGRRRRESRPRLSSVGRRRRG